MPIEKESPEEMGYERIACNLAESSVTDLRLSDLGISLEDCKLEYISHRGHRQLRERIAADAGLADCNTVLLTNGAAGALFIVHSALLNPGDHAIIIRPNYATNIAVPETIGCRISYIDLQFENGWRMDIDAIRAAMRPDTQLISITTPHNPTGMVMREEEWQHLRELAEKNNIWLLADETYRDAGFVTSYPLLASQSKKVISVSSLSKAFGLPGLRTGWLVTQDKDLQEQFLAAKEMIYISNAALDEAAAFAFYAAKDAWAASIAQHVQVNFQLLKTWLQEERRLECVLPEGGVVCFPRFVEGLRSLNTDDFYRRLMTDYGTMPGPGHWFSMPDRYMRLGFGWPDADQLRAGLQSISKTITDCGF